MAGPLHPSTVGHLEPDCLTHPNVKKPLKVPPLSVKTNWWARRSENMKRPSSFPHSSLVDEITDNFREVSKEALSV